MDLQDAERLCCMYETDDAGHAMTGKFHIVGSDSGIYVRASRPSLFLDSSPLQLQASGFLKPRHDSAHQQRQSEVEGGRSHGESSRKRHQPGLNAARDSRIHEQHRGGLASSAHRAPSRHHRNIKAPNCESRARRHGCVRGPTTRRRHPLSG